VRIHVICAESDMMAIHDPGRMKLAFELIDLVPAHNYLA
jgi:hypothetical protein